MSSLSRLATRTLVMLLAAAILLPAAGSLIDHHFADRQPGHLHVGSSGLEGHSHSYTVDSHYHPAPKDIPDQPVAIYRSEGATVAVPAVATADSLLGSMMSFKPSSVILMPLVAYNSTKQPFEAPPDHPPQFQI